MLAYVFWHHPRHGDPLDAYEQAQIAFHRSLAHVPPAGFAGSATYRVAGLPWLDVETSYEDWYFVEDYTALGVLNEAAVGHGHRSAHDALARRFGGGTGGLYGLVEGSPHLDGATAIWIARPQGSERRPLGELLGDGMDPSGAGLWRRQLVLGPAPELCLLAGERSDGDRPAGIAATRLPSGWSAISTTHDRLKSA